MKRINAYVVLVLLLSILGRFSIVYAAPDPKVVLEQMSYHVVDQSIQPLIELQIYSTYTQPIQVGISIDTYETGYYRQAQTYTREVSGRMRFSFPIMAFTHANQTYHLVIRLWQGNQTVQSNVFAIFSAHEHNQLIRYDNAFIQQPLRVMQDDRGQTITYYQTLDFRHVFLFAEHPIPTIDVATMYFQYTSVDAFIYDSAILYIEDGFEDSDIPYQEKGYRFPLEIVKKHGFYFFRLNNNYFFDYQQGVMKLTPNSNTLPTDKLVLSFQRSLTQVYAHIEMTGVTAHKGVYYLDLHFHFINQVFGRCGEALICIRKKPPLLNVEYTYSRQVG